MKFCWSTIMVNDMEESLKFYKEIVGLKENRRFIGGTGVDIAFLGEGETQIELIHDKDSKGSKKVSFGTDISLGFKVPSVDEMIAFIEDKGIEIHSGPFQPMPQVKFFYVLDPNGLKIQFVE